MSESLQGLVVLAVLAMIFISFIVNRDRSRREYCQEHGHQWRKSEDLGLYCCNCGEEPQ